MMLVTINSIVVTTVNIFVIGNVLSLNVQSMQSSLTIAPVEIDDKLEVKTLFINWIGYQYTF